MERIRITNKCSFVFFLSLSFFPFVSSLHRHTWSSLHGPISYSQHLLFRPANMFRREKKKGQPKTLPSGRRLQLLVSRCAALCCPSAHFVLSHSYCFQHIICVCCRSRWPPPHLSVSSIAFILNSTGSATSSMPVPPTGDPKKKQKKTKTKKKKKKKQKKRREEERRIKAIRLIRLTKCETVERCAGRASLTAARRLGWQRRFGLQMIWHFVQFAKSK